MGLFFKKMSYWSDKLNKFGADMFKHYYNRTKDLSLKQIDRRARFLSNLYYKIDKKRMDIARNNMKIAFGDKYSSKEIEQLIKDCLYNFCVEFFMFFTIGHKPKDVIREMFTYEHKDYVDEALAMGKGVIFLTGHIGNWEFLARRLCYDGIILSVIARDSDHVGITEVTNNIRNSGGYSVYSKDRPLMGIIKALKRKETIGILPDQSNEDGIWVKFFGADAKTAAGTAMFSLKTGAPIVPVFAIRESLGKYRLDAYPMIKYEPTGNMDEDVKNLTQLCNDALEKEIRENPSSWLWIHNRFKPYEREEN